MLYTLHIVISDNETGETVIGIKEPVDVKNPSSRLQSFLAEKYILMRLLDDMGASNYTKGRKRIKQVK